MNFKQNSFSELTEKELATTVGGVNPLALIYLGVLGTAYSTGYKHGKDLAKK